MRFTRMVSAGAAVLALLPLATACGIADDIKATRLAQKARDAVHTAGSMTVDEDQPAHEHNPHSRFTADLQGNCTGERSMSAGKVLFRMIGDENWSHPDRAWLDARPSTESPEVRESVAQRLLKWRPNRDAETLRSDRAFCAFERITDLIWSDAPATKTREITKVGTGTVGQTPVVVLRSTGPLGIATVSVAAEGIPYPLKIEFRSSGTRPSSTILLSGFEEKVLVPRPSTEETWDPSDP